MSDAETPLAVADLAPPRVVVEKRADGSLVLTSPVALGAYSRHIGVLLRQAAAAVPERRFLAERDAGGGWRGITYGEIRRRCDRVAQALLDRGLGPERPLMILSGNSIDHATLSFAAMQAGVPVAPVSVAYSLISTDFAKLAHVRDLVRPALVFADDGERFAAALAVACESGAEAVSTTAATATPFSALLEAEAGAAVEDAFAAVGPDTVAKYLFTSGSTGEPKGVINTQRMLCANQQMSSQVRAREPARPPLLLDWLPWNHTYGGNAVLNGVIRNQGTLHIDAGRPQPGLFETTIANLREISPTIYYSVPAGYGMLVAAMERDQALRDCFFAKLEYATYAGADLPRDLWQRIQALARAATGRRLLMLTGWGSTETAPSVTALHWETDGPGVIGLPLPGCEVKMVPSGAKMELRVRGPAVFPGYLGRPDLTAEAFDEEGFYRIGDAGRLADAHDPAKGIRFDGRVVEDFKLATGTWVHAGGVRIAAIAAASPVIQDTLVAGHDRDFLALLAWPNIAACRRLAGEELAVQDLIRDAAVIEALRKGLAAHNAANRGSSTAIRRVILLAAPPSLDSGEITDKGYINQLAGLESRAAEVTGLYAEPPDDAVIVIA